MNPKVRIMLGFFIVIIGGMMVFIGIRHRHQLWSGVQTKEVPASLVSNIPVITKQQKLEAGQFDTGNLEIQNKYETKDNHLPSGDYQVRDVNNKIWMLKLCPAENDGVLPDFVIGSVVNIVYVKGNDCYRFLNATLIKEAEKK